MIGFKMGTDRHKHIKSHIRRDVPDAIWALNVCAPKFVARQLDTIALRLSTKGAYTKLLKEVSENDGPPKLPMKLVN